MVVVELNKVLGDPNNPPPTAPYTIKYKFNIAIKHMVNKLIFYILINNILHGLNNE